jgi:hypothetical protein
VAHSYTYDTRNRLTALGVAKGATAIAISTLAFSGFMEVT